MLLDGSAETELNATQWRSNRAKTQLFGSAVAFGGLPGLNEGPQNDRLLVLVSDGASGDLNGADAVSGIVDRLNEAGITMYHIHIGSDTIPNAVSTIAEETGAEHSSRRTPMDLNSFLIISIGCNRRNL